MYHNYLTEEQTNSGINRPAYEVINELVNQQLAKNTNKKMEKWTNE